MYDRSMEMASERVCYVHCNFCNTILAVSVPCSSMLAMVTVRCGHCGNHLSLNMAALHPTHLLQHLTGPEELVEMGKSSSDGSSSSSSARKAPSSFESAQHHPPPPGKRKRVPSVYNKFIKEEIQRIKARNPEVSHREAFSLAAKNWAHFPTVHFGVTLEGQQRSSKLGLAIAGEETQLHSLGF